MALASDGSWGLNNTNLYQKNIFSHLITTLISKILVTFRGLITRDCILVYFPNLIFVSVLNSWDKDPLNHCVIYLNSFCGLGLLKRHSHSSKNSPKYSLGTRPMRGASPRPAWHRHACASADYRGQRHHHSEGSASSLPRKAAKFNHLWLSRNPAARLSGRSNPSTPTAVARHIHQLPPAEINFPYEP